MTQEVAANKTLSRQISKLEEFAHLVFYRLASTKILEAKQNLSQLDYKIYSLKSFLIISLIALFTMVWSLNPSTAIAQGINRADKVVNIIDRQNQDLCEDSSSNNCKILDDKYCKMGGAAFPFYRATNYLFWNDFAKNKRLEKFGSKKTKTWIVGDLHVDNFGTFENSKGDIIFNMNDFDESVIADYQYDVWRMATSIVLVARNPEMKNFFNNQTNQEKIINAFTESYLDTIASYRGNDKEVKTDFTLDSIDFKLSKLLDKNRAKKSPTVAREDMLGKWTNKNGKLEREYKLDSISETSPIRKKIKEAISDYSKLLAKKLDYKLDDFEVKDIAKRINAGLGSLGTPRYYVLIDEKSKKLKDSRILDVKLQSKPTPYSFLGSDWQKEYDHLFGNDAERQEIAYKALINNADPYLGWIELSNGFYSIRDRSPFKDSIRTTLEKEDKNKGKKLKLNDIEKFTNMAKLWGKILATAHARADKDFDSNLIPYSFEKQVDELTKGHHQEFRALVRKIAFDYADRVEADYEAFVATLKPQNCEQSN